MLMLSLTAVSSHAQQNERRVRFSVLSEPHLNWLYSDVQKVVNGPLRLGIGGGLRLDYFFQSHYAFSVGVNMNVTGGNLVYQDPLILNRTTGLDTLAPGSTITYRLQYVEIPIAIKLLTREIGYLTYFAEFGLDPLINNRALINATDNNIESDPYQHEIGTFNLAYHGGFGVHYSFGGDLSLIVALEYKNSFLDLTLDKGLMPPDNIRLNQAALKIGILF